MASENSKRLQSGLGPVLKQHGYKKTRATWRKYNDEVISVLNLQGSQWGAFFYVNLGSYFRALGDRDQPLEYQCHVRTRLCDLVPDNRLLSKMLDFETQVDENLRVKVIENLIVENALPWLDELSSLKGANAFCNNPRPSKFIWITLEAKAFLESTNE